MPLFRRRGREEDEPPPVPEWASFFDAERYRTFLGLVDEALERLGLPRAWQDGAVDTEVGGERVTFGLANLAQQCHAEPVEAWPAMVEEHFRRMVGLFGQDRAEPSFDEARPLLKLRLWPREDVPEGADLVARPVADDLLLTLALDWPEEVSSVGSATVASWGVDEDELFELAAANTRAEPDVEVQRLEDGEGRTTTFLVSDSFFGATLALWPDAVEGAVGEHGALIAMPYRHLAAMFPIDDLEVVGVISTLVPFVHRRFVEGPGSVSPHLYWWRPDGVVRLPAGVGDDAVQFFPPDEFVELLNRLGDADG